MTLLKKYKMFWVSIFHKIWKAPFGLKNFKNLTFKGPFWALLPLKPQNMIC